VTKTISFEIKSERNYFPIKENKERKQRGEGKEDLKGESVISIYYKVNEKC
jgi:hypothetical protein